MSSSIDASVTLAKKKPGYTAMPDTSIQSLLPPWFVGSTKSRIGG
jgi:hypothetical protein